MHGIVGVVNGGAIATFEEGYILSDALVMQPCPAQSTLALMADRFMTACYIPLGHGGTMSN